MRWRSWLNYFRNPFPGRDGFSPYRFPGVAVHIPVLLAIVLLGYQLNAGRIWLVPALVVYLVAGFYWGRDLAVYAHYNVLIILAVGVFFLAYGPWLVPLFAALRSAQSFPFVSLITDIAVLLGFMIYAARRA